MIKQVQASYNPAQLEKAVREFWTKTDAYKKTKELRAGGPDYYFVDGPPYTTGYIHLGTAWNKTIKDTIIRFKRMQRFNVTDTPGYDMHGLPIEVKVEQSIGVKNKKEIEEYGIDRFVGTCKEFALGFQKKMNEQFSELGVWMDWDNPYLTINSSYIEAAWWTLKRAHDKGLLVTANRVLPGCPRCETALAEAEIEYSDEKDPSIYVKFPLRNDEKVSLLIWTTTPWTLPANMAVAAHPDFKYVKVRYRRIGETETVIALKDLVEQIRDVGGWEKYDILENIEGDDLVGTEYLPPFGDEVPYQRNVDGKWVHKVIPSKTVEATNTGLVHIAPGHGPEDFELGKEFGIEPFCPVEANGKFSTEVGEKYQGIHIKKANPLLIEDLKEKGILFWSGIIEHRFGHCWRCNTPVIFRSTQQWFLKVTAIKNLMLEEVERIRWTPDWAGSSRMYDWVLNARDWCISRQRYWGIPIPVWTCASCGEVKVIGSVAELEMLDGYRKDMELHRPWIDSVTCDCPKCNKTMRRVPDVLDVWFDSAVASWAQLGFPAKRTEFDRWWPGRWITEAQDQTRGWFYSQLAAGCIAFGRAPYESVLMHGWMLDPSGQPMSKSKGNVIEPIKVIADYGADALRFYMLRSSAPWEDIAFQWEGVKNARKMLNVFWNVVNFAAQYMAIDKFDPSTVDYDRLKGHLRSEDKWLISKTEKLKHEVTRSINTYDLHKACRAIEEFVLDDLSRWYVRLIRDRMWKEEGDLDKLAAYKVLFDSAMATNALLAPFCPHITEEVYQHLDGSKGSVHMLDWPLADLTKVDERLETSMKECAELVEIITRERQARNVKLRWPMKRIIIKASTQEAMDSIMALDDILLSQSNTKSVQYIKPGQEWEETILNVIPNPHAIGKVYRQWSSKIAVLLKSRPAKQIKESIDKGEYSLGIEGQLVKIEPNMVSFTTSLPNEVIGAKFSGGEVYLDFQVTMEIEAEGFAREIIRRIQQMRKDMKLDVEEFVKVEVTAPVKIIEYFKIWKEHIMSETRSKKLDFVDDAQGTYKVSWEVEGHKMEIGITSTHIKEALTKLAGIPGLTHKMAMYLAEKGFCSADDLKNLGEEKLGNMEGFTKSDAKRIFNHLVRKDEGKKCETCGGAMDIDGRCLTCSTVPGTGTPKERLIPFLLRVPRMNKLKAEMLYDAGYDNIGKIETAGKDDLAKVSGLGARTIDGLLVYAQGGGFKTIVKCHSCGADIRPDELKCPNCGVAFREDLVDEEDEEKAKTKSVDDLERSFAYLIKEDRSERSYAFFEKALSQGLAGFCVTRNYPLKIKSKYNLGDTQILWLSNVGKENSLRPKDLEKLSYSLEQFLANNSGVILLDGLEYLITNNNFLTVLRFIQSLRDQVAINRSILIMALNPSTLDPHELNLLEKEVDVAL